MQPLQNQARERSTRSMAICGEEWEEFGSHTGAPISTSGGGGGGGVVPIGRGGRWISGSRRWVLGNAPAPIGEQGGSESQHGVAV